MATKTACPLADAKRVADKLLEALEPFCERIAIAGSIRRMKPEVGDIELLCVSKYSAERNDLFGTPVANLPLLDTHLQELIDRGIFDYRLNSRGARTFGLLNKYLVHVESGIAVDIFSTTVKNWGMTLLVRTGPRDYNIRVFALLRSKGLEGHAYGGITGRYGVEMRCPTEEDVYRVLGWPWEPPDRRI